MAAQAAATSAAKKAEPLTIQQQWEATLPKAPAGFDISKVPGSIRALINWVTAVATALGAPRPEENDQLGTDSSGYILEPYFGLLQGARLMNALGTNNDCLVHSFLSCVCHYFRRYTPTIRSTMASFFRRFIMIQLPNVSHVNIARLTSNGFLETDELDLLCQHFIVKFIIVKRGRYPVDRQFELVPNTLNTVFWTNARKNEPKMGNPFYVIHGSGAHFTPVSRRDSDNDIYTFNNTFAELFALQTKIHDEREADRAVDEVRRSETNRVMREFVNSHYNNLDDLKAIMASAAPKDEKMTILSEVIAEFVDPLHTYIATLPPQYRRDYAEQMAFDYITTTLMGDKGSATSKASAPSTPTTLQSTYKPDMDLEAALEESIITAAAEAKANAADNAQTKKALAASVATPIGNNTPATVDATQRAKELSLISYQVELMKSVKAGIEKAKGTSNTNTRAPGESNSEPVSNEARAIHAHISNEISAKIAKIFAKGLGEAASRTSGNQKILRTVNATATVGTTSTQYNAIVYNPVTVQQSKGGKRITKKAKRSKNRKTKKSKKLKKQSV